MKGTRNKLSRTLYFQPPVTTASPNNSHIQSHCSHSFETAQHLFPPQILEIRETMHGQTEVNSKNLQTCLLSPRHFTSLMIRGLRQEEPGSIFQAHHVLDINKVIKPCSIDSYHRGDSQPREWFLLMQMAFLAQN